MVDQQRRAAPKRLPKPVGLLVVAIVLLALVAGIGLGGRKLIASFSGPADYHGSGTGKVVVQVKSGDSAADIGRTLLAKGVVKSVRAFTQAAAKDTRSRSVQPGFYGLRAKMSGAAALALLLDPRSRLKGRVTLPEGIPVAKVVDRLVQYTDLKRAEVLAALDNPVALGLPSYAQGRVEGFLFPSTYDVDPKSGAVAALTQMTERFQEQAAGIDLEARSRELGLSPYDVVKIASLVEAETPRDEDRSKVARVILNRLAKGMALQLDSTVNYGLPKPKPRLSLDDIHRDTPYNSYTRRGLPPTPINSPGTHALEASLAPAQGDWLYFITIDKQGHSLFTSSYEEFVQAKAKAQREGVY